MMAKRMMCVPAQGTEVSCNGAVPSTGTTASEAATDNSVPEPAPLAQDPLLGEWMARLEKAVR
ncbi:MAG: hypothetical protein FD153_453 [Rhodospirillaceae bacterium]|nr:MAG: hypothetical protein FD153_453 [Rhodospirillaceae bacterium]